MTRRLCLGWAGETCRRVITNTNRCTEHEAARRARSNARHRPHRERRPDYTSAERQRRAQAVAAWRAEHGDWCPGWGVAAHPSTDLTADHVIPVAAGGGEGGALTVLCRPCNGRKGSNAA